MKSIEFLDRNGTFSLGNAENISYLYFPLAGEGGLKSAVTPNLGGDSKLDQESFLLEPVSSENLHNNRSTRNFWVVTEDGVWSATGVSAQQEAERFTPAQDQSRVTAGLMWHTVSRESVAMGLRAELTSFVPVHETAEVLHVRITNTAEAPKAVTGIGAIPIYGRSADNIRDHRNVTSMLHRIWTTEQGVIVKPTMSFDEKGHRTNDKLYYVMGATGSGEAPAAFYPTVEEYLGEGGTFLHPRAVYENQEGVGVGAAVDGREAMGGICFAPVTLNAGATTEFVLVMGITTRQEELKRIAKELCGGDKAEAALQEVKSYWKEQVNVQYRTADDRFDALMRWVSFQPFLRRIFGCSFLPHHDYGRGGRGWRDLWQDCLSLLLMNPSQVREMIAANFGGVRLDGTNATIIGAGLGSFIADRNGIARVWMDHALWPLMTTQLYIDQTGDITVLDEPVCYFKDAQSLRGTAIDALWSETDGNRQRTAEGMVYQGSILEHLLVQQLTAFYEVGEHNVLRMRGADWNDALDMAAERGESVAFTYAYAGNLRTLAALLRDLSRITGEDRRCVLAELKLLLGQDTAIYDSVEQKNAILAQYTQSCRHSVSGAAAELSLSWIAEDLDTKAAWLMEHLRRQEWLSIGEDDGWFNSYYDNNGRRVEGITERGVRMMLTGQVFAIMGGTATEEQIRTITRSADRYLYREEIGGYRLNTDFQELKFDMGRMFGFAYGEKENGAVFSHMTTMYANALYQRGFVREGWKALSTLARAALNFNTSKIYPGIPEYFRIDGRGVYHYLTGAASWFMMTVITQVFGVRGELGQLIIEPKLVREQFDKQGEAGISLVFAGKKLHVTYRNAMGKDYGAYQIGSATLNDSAMSVTEQGEKLVLSRTQLQEDSQLVIELI